MGDAIWFRVVDYRGTEQGPPDRSTMLGFAGGGIVSPVDYCGARPWPAGDARTWPVIKGGIIVKP